MNNTNDMICDKITYASHKLAQDAALGLSNKKGKGMKAYKCRDCGSYHITTVKPRKKGMFLKEKYKHDATKPIPKEIKIPSPSKKKSSQKSLPYATYKPFAYLRDKNT